MKRFIYSNNNQLFTIARIHLRALASMSVYRASMDQQIITKTKFKNGTTEMSQFGLKL